MEKSKLTQPLLGPNRDPFPILEPNKNFYFDRDESRKTAKGTRKKLPVVTLDGHRALFKYQAEGRKTSELCSEKIAYEIAKVLGYSCARIEFAVDEEGNHGILNFLFTDDKKSHYDYGDFAQINNENRSEEYVLPKIKAKLSELPGDNLYQGFMRILFFSALIGDGDRHEDNWGLLENMEDGGFLISPIYDNGDSLLCGFSCEEYAEKYYSGQRSFDAYCKNGKSIIRKTEGGSRYGLFELIEQFHREDPVFIEKEIANLEKLTDDKIADIIHRVPCGFLTEKHIEFMINYVIKRKTILTNIKEKK